MLSCFTLTVGPGSWLRVASSLDGATASDRGVQAASALPSHHRPVQGFRRVCPAYTSVHNSYSSSGTIVKLTTYFVLRFSRSPRCIVPCLPQNRALHLPPAGGLSCASGAHPCDTPAGQAAPAAAPGRLLWQARPPRAAPSRQQRKKQVVDRCFSRRLLSVCRCKSFNKLVERHLEITDCARSSLINVFFRASSSFAVL